MGNKGTKQISKKASKGEKIIFEYFVRKKYHFIYDSYHQDFGKYRPDFILKHKKNKYMIEFDGKQHFEYNRFFHKNYDDFKKRQNDDILKQNIALEKGYKVIRIDYNNIHLIKYHIKNGINSKEKIYYSNFSCYSYFF